MERNEPHPAPPGTIAGRVSDAGGGPVAGARVAFIDGPVPMPDVAVLTDAGGWFVLAVPAPGEYRISFHASGFSTAVTRALVKPDEGAAVQVSLAPEK